MPALFCKNERGVLKPAPIPRSEIGRDPAIASFADACVTSFPPPPPPGPKVQRPALGTLYCPFRNK